MHRNSLYTNQIAKCSSVCVLQVLPKYFQLAEVVDSPIDFYSSRVPKKHRKRTMAEEIMHDEEALR